MATKNKVLETKKIYTFSELSDEARNLAVFEKFV